LDSFLGEWVAEAIASAKENSKVLTQLLHLLNGFPKALARFKVSQQILNDFSSFDHHRNAESELPTY
jgi:hypothetical protein